VLHFGGIINTVSRNFTFSGQIDELSIWNRGLSAPEIDDYHQSILTGGEEGLVAYYRMSDGEGTSLTDDSGNGWNGTLLDGGQGVPPSGGPAAWVVSTAPIGGSSMLLSRSFTPTSEAEATVAVLGRDAAANRNRPAGTPHFGGLAGMSAAAQRATIARGVPIGETGFLASPEDAWKVTVPGTLAHVADARVGLRIFDVSNAANAAEIGSLEAAGPAYAVEISGRHAYVAAGSSGLNIVDVSNPEAPVRVGGADTPGFASGIFVDLPYVYVADGLRGVRIFDASDSARPVETGSLSMGGQAADVVVRGGLMYVADYRGAVRVVDVSNPAHPVEVGSADAPGAPSGLIQSGDYLFVAAGEAGLLLFDISDPANPVQAGFVSMASGFACVADHENGLRMIRVR
jgi:hypothetical protein